MHIIFYVLDSLRADHLSCYGYHRKTSPHIDSIAADGVIFQKCYSTSTWTRPVAASILSGTYPAINGVQGRNALRSWNQVRDASTPYVRFEFHGPVSFSLDGRMSAPYLRESGT